MIEVCQSVPECADPGTRKNVAIPHTCAGLCQCAGYPAHARMYSTDHATPGTLAHIARFGNNYTGLSLCRGRHTLAHSGTQGRIPCV